MQLKELQGILDQITGQHHVQDKVVISATHDKIGESAKLPSNYRRASQSEQQVLLGDDCSAIPDGAEGYLLFASEGIISDFLERDPWFAGYCSVMVNISDVLAMGGLPIAVTDVIWGQDKASLDEVWEGMVAASSAYDVPIVGGHTCYRSTSKALAVSILGRANNLLTSFSASPGQQLLMAIDMAGDYYEHYPFWNASTNASRDKLLTNISVMQEIADQALSECAKDISMGGLLGTIAMLGNTSGVGFDIHFDGIIPPPDGDWLRWLIAFPSFGFILTCDERHTNAIVQLFHEHRTRCQVVGTVRQSKGISVWKNDTPIKFM